MEHNSPPGFGQLAWQGLENSVVGLCDALFPAWGPLGLLPGGLCVLVRARRGAGAGAGPLAHPAHLSSRPGARPQPGMPAAEPALPGRHREAAGTWGLPAGKRGVWLQAGPPGCKTASGMGLGHLRDAARDAARQHLRLGQDTPAPQPVHSQSLIFVSSKGSVG